MIYSQQNADSQQNAQVTKHTIFRSYFILSFPFKYFQLRISGINESNSVSPSETGLDIWKRKQDSFVSNICSREKEHQYKLRSTLVKEKVVDFKKKKNIGVC